MLMASNTRNDDEGLQETMMGSGVGPIRSKVPPENEGGPTGESLVLRSGGYLLRVFVQIISEPSTRQTRRPESFLLLFDV
jgi:hypothetical protein